MAAYDPYKGRRRRSRERTRPGGGRYTSMFVSWVGKQVTNLFTFGEEKDWNPETVGFFFLVVFGLCVLVIARSG